MSNMPTPADIANMQAHIGDTLVTNVIVSCAISSAASLVILALRVYARFSTHRKLALSDYMFIASVIFFWAFCVVFALSTHYGAGRHIILITDPADSRMLAILNILNVITYGIAACFVKWSILALYIAIFPQQKFRYWVWFLSLLNLGSLIAIVLVTCLQCIPLEALWDTTVTGTCINFSYFSIFNTSFSFSLDLLILVSPLPLVWKLKLSTRKRMLLAVNFAFGGGACIVAIIRLPFSQKVGGTVDPSWDMIPGGMLCVAEVVVAHLCASLAIYRPLFRRLAPNLSSTADAYNYRENSRGPNDYPGSQVSTRITANGSRLPRRTGIAVTDDIDMSTHTYVNGKWVQVPDDDDQAGLFPPKSMQSSSKSLGSSAKSSSSD